MTAPAAPFPPPGLARHRYTLLLVLLIGGLVVQSVMVSRVPLMMLHDAIGTLVTVVTFLVVFRPGRLRAVAFAALVALIAIRWLRFVVPREVDHALFVAFEAIDVAYYTAAVWQILQDLFSAPVVGAENVRGAICGYLLLGAAWTGVNTLTWLAAPAAFSVAPAVAPLTADWSGTSALFSYYSFTQLLTLGYSDVTPLRAPATTWSLFAALSGMFYTAVVVSQLVGMASAHRRGA